MTTPPATKTLTISSTLHRSTQTSVMAVRFQEHQDAAAVYRVATRDFVVCSVVARLETIQWVLSEAHNYNWDKVILHLDDKVMAKQLYIGVLISKETKAITDDIFLLGSLFEFYKFGIDPNSLVGLR